MIILDFGSGNTCKNNKDYIAEMIDQLEAADNTSEDFPVVIKWQLFISAGDNMPLTRNSFDFAYKYALRKGYRTTASVFDPSSLELLLSYKVPFIKVANNSKLYHLLGLIPRAISIVCSFKGDLMKLENNPENFFLRDDHFLSCVSKYPATSKDYEEQFSKHQLRAGISDHTTDWKLYKKYKPLIYECHYKLEDSTGLD